MKFCYLFNQLEHYIYNFFIDYEPNDMKFASNQILVDSRRNRIPFLSGVHTELVTQIYLSMFIRFFIHVLSYKKSLT